MYDCYRCFINRSVKNCSLVCSKWCLWPQTFNVFTDAPFRRKLISMAVWKKSCWNRLEIPEATRSRGTNRSMQWYRVNESRWLLFFYFMSCKCYLITQSIIIMRNSRNAHSLLYGRPYLYFSVRHDWCLRLYASFVYLI